MFGLLLYMVLRYYIYGLLLLIKITLVKCEVIIPQGLLDPVGTQHCDVTEWLCFVLSILIPVFTFNLGLNAVKSTHHTKKSSK